MLVNAARTILNNSEEWWDFMSEDWRVGLGREECPHRCVAGNSVGRRILGDYKVVLS